MLQMFLDYFSCFATNKLLQSSRFFRLIFLTPFSDMPSLNRNKNFVCENCGTLTTELILDRHKKRC